MTCFPQVQPRLECNDMRVVCWIWQILHVQYDKRLNEDEGEWWGWGELVFFFLFKRINMWYHDAFHYFLSIYVIFGQFTFGPVSSHICTGPKWLVSSKSQSLTVLGINRMKFFLKFTSIFIFTINNILNEHKCEALVHTSKFKINFK